MCTLLAYCFLRDAIKLKEEIQLDAFWLKNNDVIRMLKVEIIP